MAAIVQMLGFAVIAVGAGLVYLPAGFIVAGLGIAAFGVAMERRDA